ncbi:hypothetical protein SO802_028295 [Lithocarpus litseifolius]|uniref:Uncharacterized protein n=1 Tax=Lithocarpus litseifolius TaxID=425828 RepID=A0AAW2BQ53_9ROSI
MVFVERNGETLNQWRALNAELEKDVKRVHQREELLTKVESMIKKFPWLKYDMKKAEYMEAKEQEKDAKKKLDEAAKTLNDLKEPIEKQKQEKAVLDAKCKKAGHLINENSKRLTELMSNESHLGVLVRGKYKEMEDLRKQEESRQQRIIKAKEDLATTEAELENLPLYEPPKDELIPAGIGLCFKNTNPDSGRRRSGFVFLKHKPKLRFRPVSVCVSRTQTQISDRHRFVFLKHKPRSTHLNQHNTKQQTHPTTHSNNKSTLRPTTGPNRPLLHNHQPPPPIFVSQLPPHRSQPLSKPRSQTQKF